jgi:hypothetical protein
MRKLLLATTAAIAASLGGAGIAQAQISTVPTLVPGTSPFSAAKPEPGTVIVRLGGRVYASIGFLSDSGNKTTVPATTTPAGTGSGTTAIPAGTYKQNNYYEQTLLYLYPSVDGVAANGLQYGAFVEIRSENYLAPGNTNLIANSGGGSISASDRAQYLYLRRAYGYFGLPSLGTLRFGTTDGPTSLFETGTFENFNDGGWNGSTPNGFSSNTTPVFPFVGGTGAEYATNKIVYLSPQFYGFDFGLSFEPTASSNGYDGGNSIGLNSTLTGLANGSGCGYASTGCARLDSTPVAGEVARRLNAVEFDSRYRGTFGAVAVALEAGWWGSQHERTSATNIATRYQGLNVGQFGATFSYAGLTVGGHWMYGQYNQGDNLNPVGAVPSSAAIGGASYAQGPWIIGASYYVYDGAGSSGPAPISTTIKRERSVGIAAGGNYTIAPGVSTFLSALYGSNHELGVNLLGDGEGANAHNNTHASGLFVGTNIRW